MKRAPTLTPDAAGLRIGILRSEFNEPVVSGLVSGAREALALLGGSPSLWVEVKVPGAFELPLAARALALSGKVDALVALGAVIRGETDHYEHISRAATDGLAEVARETLVPVGFGVLTVHDEAQALHRSAPGPGNKGAEAARAAVTMALVLKKASSRGKRRNVRGGARG